MKNFLKKALDKSFQVIPKVSDESVILMLHRVGKRDPERIPANQNMVILLEELYSFIVDSRNRGWSFISLEELNEALKIKRNLSKTLTLTFDDGYLDNATEAAPLLIDQNVPFVVYVTTGFVGFNDMPWWYMVETILTLKQYVKLPDGSIIYCSTLKEKQAAFLEIRRVLMSSSIFANSYYEWIQNNYSQPSVETGRLFMNWDDLRKLSNQPLVTIGAHTHSHPILSGLNDFNSFEEIRISKEFIENQLGKPVRHFAYPFGGSSEAGEREYRQVEALGFETAVTTRMGAIHIKQCNQFSLPRCFFGPGMTLDFLQKQLFKKKLQNLVKRLNCFD